MSHSEYNGKKFGKILKMNGYELSRTKGSHFIYTKPGCNPIVIKAELNAMVARRIIKENAIVV